MVFQSHGFETCGDRQLVDTSRISDTCYFCTLMKSNSHLQAAHNLSPGPQSGVRASGTLKNLGAMKTYKKMNMRVFPKTFVVVIMHNCKAIF